MPLTPQQLAIKKALIRKTYDFARLVDDLDHASRKSFLAGIEGRFVVSSRTLNKLKKLRLLANKSN